MRRETSYDAILNERLPPEEFEKLASRTPEERAADIELIAWFMRRYPTPEERLAYARRAYRRWTGAE